MRLDRPPPSGIHVPPGHAMPGVVGVKHAVGGVDADTVALLGDVPDGFAVPAGDDVFAPGLLGLGAHGGILASAHRATERRVALAKGYEPGLGHRLARMAGELFAEPNPAVVKGVLRAQGRIPTADVRLPLLPAGAGTVERALVSASGTGAHQCAASGDTRQNPRRTGSERNT